MNVPSTKTSSPSRKRASQPRQDSAVTRTRILDCAERLFARNGFHGTSVRDIALLAEVQFALVGYHFGSKLDLLDRVIARRSEVLNAARRSFLSRARRQHGNEPIPVQTLLEGFVGNLISRASASNSGWRAYTRLIAGIASSAEWSELTDKHFNATAREYLSELQRTFPAAKAEPLHQAFFFSVGAMLAVCARPGRIESLSAGRFSGDVAKLSQPLCGFLEGGFRMIANNGC